MAQNYVGPSSGITFNGSRANISRMQFVRSFQFYPKQIDTAGKPQSNWLDKVLKVGVIAMKIFALLLGSPSNLEASVAYVTSSCMCMLIRVEDLIRSSPIDEGTGKLVRFVDFRKFRLNKIKISVTSGSVLSQQAGRFAISIAALSREESDAIRRGGVIDDTADIQQIVQMPKSVVAPYGKAVSISCVPTDFQAMPHLIGAAKSSDVKPRAGVPLYRLYLAYSDFAARSPKPSDTYSPFEVMLQVDVTCNVTLMEPGRRFYSSNPQLTMDSGSIQLSTELRDYSIPVEFCTITERGELSVDNIVFSDYDIIPADV